MPRTSVSAVLLGALLVLACDGDPTVPREVTSLQIAGSANLLGQAGEMAEEEPTVRAVDAQGDPVPGVTVTFTVMDGDGFVSPTPVSTDAQGEARASWLLGTETGEQRLRAEVEGVAPVTFTAEVQPGPPAQIQVEPDVLHFDAMGDSLQVSASFQDRFANPIDSDDVAFEWASLDADVATVSPEGWVTARRQGTAQIVARFGDLTGTTAARVMLDYRELDVVEGEVTINAITFTRELTIDVRDRNDNQVDDPDVTWTTRNAGIATVDAFGEVTAEGAGSTWIVAEGQALLDSAEVVVLQVPRVIQVGLAADSLLIGESLGIDVSASDSAGFPIAEPSLDWEVSPAMSASIVDGVLHTIGPGLVTVRASAADAAAEAAIPVYFPNEIIARLSAGANHGLAIGGPERAVYGWGWNINGSVGDGSTTRTGTPIATGIADAVQVSATGNISFALLRDGRVFAWGRNANGQLGLGYEATTVDTPEEVVGFHPVWIEAGVEQTMALMGDGTLWASGENNVGQLGDGTTETRSEFAPVTGLTDVVQVASREDYTLALRSDGTVWGWGSDNYGKLGIGGSTGFGEFETTPVQITALSNIEKIAVGRDHAIALDADGNVWTWGNNQYGQLGNGASGTGTHVSTPVQVPGLSDIAVIAGSDNSTVVADASGQVWAWGRNNYLQIGDASDLNAVQPTPTQISITDAAELHGGVWFHLMIQEDGTLAGFGRGEQGQIGHGALGTDERNIWPPQAVLVP